MMNRDFRGDRNARPDFPGFGPGLHGFGPRGFAGGFGAGFPGGFDPRGARMGRRGKGDVRTAIMALLAEQTGDAGLNGYTFMKTVAERTGGAWSPSPGSVYPTLQQLVDEGLIAASGGGRTTEYRLTDDGRAYAEEHAEQLGAWDQAERPSDETRALFESVGRLMGVLGQFRHATEEQKTAAKAKVDELRKALYLLLAD